MGASAGELIFIAVKPIIKMAITALGGVWLSHKQILTPAASRSLSLIAINFFLPALLFSKIVPSIDSQNIPQLGVLILSGIFYQVCGLMTGLLVRWLTPVPRAWRNGVVAAGIWSNWGDLPLAFVLTLTNAAPFTQEDQSLGVAYVSIFIIVFFVTMFPLNGMALIARDFTHPAVAIADPEESPPVTAVSSPTAIQSEAEDTKMVESKEGTILEKTRAQELKDGIPMAEMKRRPSKSSGPKPTSMVTTRAKPDYKDESVDDSQLFPAALESFAPITRIATADSLAISRIKSNQTADQPRQRRSSDQTLHNRKHSPSPSAPPPKPTFWRKALSLLNTFLTPPTISLILSIIIAVIPKLKALFVSGLSEGIKNAPDGQPPLEIILETATFIGNASVPCGLAILGASLSRLSLKRIPSLWSIASMAILKLVVIPIIGIAWTTGLARTSLIPDDAKMLQFVIILCGAVPTATTQVYLTQIFCPPEESPDEQLDALSSFLILQYALMLITLTATVAYSINILY
ncbi:Protein M3 [Saitoella coloradoensis]